MTPLQLFVGLISVLHASPSTSPALAYNEAPLRKIFPEFVVEGDFGTSVAVAGNVAIVGAPAVLGISPPEPGIGSAYLFDLSILGSPTRKRFHANDGAPGDGFGYSVGVSGNTAIVLSVDAGDSPAREAAAYLFDISNPSSPRQTAKLISTEDGVYYIGPAAIDGNIALVTALTGTGTFVRLFDVSSPGSPTTVDLRAQPSHSADQFGIAVAISGNNAIIGAPLDDDHGTYAGAAYLFDVTDPSSPSNVKLFAGGPAPSDTFGLSVAISGTTALVGAPDALGGGSGSAYLFDLSHLGHPTQVTLRPLGSSVPSRFGFSVAISGSTAIVGADNAAYLFDVSNPSSPVQTARLTSAELEAEDAFGISVATDGTIAIIGAAGDDDNGENAGAAYLFGVDRDGDGLLDIWETNGLDVNNDGTIDLELPALGTDPLHKDLFVEVDSMLDENGGDTLAFDLVAQQNVIQAFANVPNDLIDNPDGHDGVTLHIDNTETDLPFTLFSSGFSEFDALKNAHFGSSTLAERSDPNWSNIKAAKEKVYRYCVFGHSLGMTGLAGKAEIPGDDFMVTLGHLSPPGGTTDLQSGVFMHELGHTLSLTHAGPLSQLNADERDAFDNDDDRHNYKPNYFSVMNYIWGTLEAPYARLDYSRVDLKDLDESELVEVDGIDNSDPNFKGTFYGIGTEPPEYAWAWANGAWVDWNKNDVEDPGSVAADVNYHFHCPNPHGPSQPCPSPGQLLTGHADWPYLHFRLSGHQNFGSSVHAVTTGETEISAEIIEQSREYLPPCPGDIDRDGQTDLADSSIIVGCMSGPDRSAGVGCEPADLDQDGDADLHDFGRVQANFACP